MNQWKSHKKILFCVSGGIAAYKAPDILHGWVKAGCEYADGALNLGAVVTLERSDWSVAPVDWNGQEITVRVSRDAESLTVRAKVAGGDFRLVRVAPFVTGEVSAGPYVCAPTRPDFTVRFLSWRVVPGDASLH